jgi:hypothetical protein
VAAGQSAGQVSELEVRPEQAGAVLPASWRGHLRTVDRALGQHDVDQARNAWESAHTAAIASSSWEGLIAAGQACLRIGGAVGARPSAEPEARRAYFAALYRACQENSFEGIMRIAEAFADLGDRDIVEECIGLVQLEQDGAGARRHLAAVIGRLGLRRDGAPPSAAGSA